MSSVKKQPDRAAFEIKKGPRHVMTLSETDVEKYLDPQELLDGLEDGFRGLELGEVQSPPRPQLHQRNSSPPVHCGRHNWKDSVPSAVRRLKREDRHE